MNFEEVKGKKAKDNISGIHGVITGYCQYLHGSDSILLEYMGGQLDRREEWFPSERIELV